MELEKLNKQFYSNDEAAKRYGDKEFLLPGEETILKRIGPEIKGRQILDLGVGGGRTTPFLTSYSSNYVGVDFSSEMIAVASSTYPYAKFETGDARDLSRFADCEIDCIFFSFNGIDCLSPDGRDQCLGEIARVLKPGGYFAFSSHNREKPPARPYHRSSFSFSLNPLHLARQFKGCVLDTFNFLRNRGTELECPTYALRLDSENHYHFPMYYTDKLQQKNALESMRFNEVTCFDREGRETAADSLDLQSSWIYYLCKKP